MLAEFAVQATKRQFRLNTALCMTDKAVRAMCNHGDHANFFQNTLKDRGSVARKMVGNYSVRVAIAASLSRSPHQV